MVSEADAHHLREVMRARPGMQIIVFDGAGADYCAEIATVGPDGVSVTLTEAVRDRCESPFSLTLAQGYLKDKKMDMLVRQLTELGVRRWMPFIARRSVAVPTARRLESRYQRWMKISREAVKQCGRSQALVIESVAHFEDVLARGQSCDLKLIFWENSSLAEPMESLRDLQPKDACLIIGPEGGFDRDEIDRAVASDFRVVSMGPRILRSETAAMAASVMTQFIFGDMDQKFLDNAGGV